MYPFGRFRNLVSWHSRSSPLGMSRWALTVAPPYASSQHTRPPRDFPVASTSRPFPVVTERNKANGLSFVVGTETANLPKSRPCPCRVGAFVDALDV